MESMIDLLAVVLAVVLFLMLWRLVLVLGGLVIIYFVVKWIINKVFNADL